MDVFIHNIIAEDDSYFICDISQMRRCDHSEVDGDPTVAGAKTNTTALEPVIS